MGVKLVSQGEEVIAFINGDIDHHSASDIRKEIDAITEEKWPRLLKLDFSSVQFMDSSGIGLIMGRYKLMQRLGGNLLIVNIPSHIIRLIKLSGLSELGIIKREDEKIDATHK